MGDDVTQLSEMFHCVKVGAVDADVSENVCHTWRSWYNTSVFFRITVRPKFLVASEKWLTMCFKASSV